MLFPFSNVLDFYSKRNNQIKRRKIRQKTVYPERKAIETRFEQIESWRIARGVSELACRVFVSNLSGRNHRKWDGGKQISWPRRRYVETREIFAVLFRAWRARIYLPKKRASRAVFVANRARGDTPKNPLKSLPSQPYCHVCRVALFNREWK